VLSHCDLEHARALVVTVPDEATAELVVATAHDLAPNLPIIARAGAESGVVRLAKHGAHHVIHPELEGGLEIVRHTLLALGYPMAQIQPYVDAVRSVAYGDAFSGDEQHHVLDQLITAVRGIEIGWHPILESSPLVGQTLAQANIRAKVGASVIALVREGRAIPNPKSDTQFRQGDMVGFIGDTEELAAAGHLVNPPRVEEDEGLLPSA
jgi:CPA2 family monovalent cation:H+ antiporter-2